MKKLHSIETKKRIINNLIELLKKYEKSEDFEDEDEDEGPASDNDLFKKMCWSIYLAGMKNEILYRYSKAIDAAYKNYDFEKVKELSFKDVYNYPGMWKHKNKIRACLKNAKIFSSLKKEYGSVQNFLEKEVSPLSNAEAIQKIQDTFEYMGPATSCNFLKNTGIKDISKPDVHVIRIPYWLGLRKKYPYPLPNKLIEDYHSVTETVCAEIGISVLEWDGLFFQFGSGDGLINPHTGKPPFPICNSQKPKCNICNVKNFCSSPYKNK